ncbi:MAG: glutamate-5-semialdehyde dehydrogenase [Lachnospiraceae bacterium]|nr:glutamate-5-semialdehyde dehydrogenase [Lachnospiraceae bacterium]
MTELEKIGSDAKRAKNALLKLSEEKKNEILKKCADNLIKRADEIIGENKRDISFARESGLNEGLIDRLMLDEKRIAAMAEGLRQIAALSGVLNEVIDEFDRPNGMHIRAVRVPFGVVGIIYEARPNVTADAFGLTFKTGNAVILKGGKEAINSNMAIVKVLCDTLEENNVLRECLQLIENNDRNVTNEFMKLKQYVDVLIPRGGAGLIRAVVENATIPVIETGTGNCHIYVDESADINMAVNIIFNAKTQRISVCNACESLVVHEGIKDALLPALQRKLSEKNVELRGDEAARAVLGDDCIPATDEDYGREYLDYILSIKTVSDVDEAIAHINKYSTGHSECIITENKENAEKFLLEIDSACVYHNVSTRFTDGFEFGFGAEIGISTQKLHARGPMGLKALTTYKYEIEGNGQVRG